MACLRGRNSAGQTLAPVFLLPLAFFLCRLAVLRFNSIHAALARVELREYGCSADGVAALCMAAMGNADADVLG